MKKYSFSLISLVGILALTAGFSVNAEETAITTLSESVPATNTDTSSSTDTGEKKKKEKAPKVKKVKPPKEKNLSDNSNGQSVPFDPAQAFAKGRMNIGLAGVGFFEFSDYDELFVSTGVDVKDYRNAGFGGELFFEYSFSPRWSLTLAGQYERLTYGTKFRATIRENYFGGDALVKYHFPVKSRFAPYLAAGVGVIASSGAALPLFDVGAGAHYFISNAVSLKAQVLYKTLLTRENRIEPSIGIAFHFPNAKPEPVLPPPPPPVKIITLTGVNFDTAKWSIRADSVPILEQNLSELTSSPKITIKIVGHTDNRGSDAYNQGLSEKRAQAVMNWFVEHGVDATRITSEGRGESEPAAPNDSADNMFKNRRIEIHITGGQ